MSKICPTCAAYFSDETAFCPSDGAPLRAAELGESLIGTVVAERYLVTGLIGEGGMGKVYRARHVKLPREAAIKVMHASLVRDPAALARFSREAAAASKVEHENVARVFDFGETADGLVYLAMEFLDGKTIKQLLASERALVHDRVARLVQQIGAGLEAAHQRGIVHRDLKPDNVIVVSDARGRETAKLVDFGIAKALGAGERALTRTGFVVGTPEYMSPEQLLGEEVDQRSDVYALALLSYQLLTGETPFDSRTPDRGLIARLGSAPRRLAEVRPDRQWSDEVQTVIDLGLHRDRAQRTPSAKVFAQAFERAMRAQPSRRQPVPVVPPARAGASPGPRDGRASAGAVAAAATPPSPAPVWPPRAPLTPQVTYGPPRRPRWRLPRVPLLRWTVAASVMGFGYLVLTEGGVDRAVRRLTLLARELESMLR